MVVPSSRLRRGWIVAIGVTVTVLGAGLVGLVVWPSQPSPDQVMQLVGEANQTLALLENQQLDQARVGLEALAAVVPTDQFVVQNTAHLLPLNDTTRGERNGENVNSRGVEQINPAFKWLETRHTVGAPSLWKGRGPSSFRDPLGYQSRVVKTACCQRADQIPWKTQARN